MYKTLITLFFICSSCCAVAHDLGVVGNVYPIQEVSIKKVIQNQASQINWNRVGNEIKQKAAAYGSNLKTIDLPVAHKTKTTYIDPSVALNRNIYISGHLLYRKGTWINPLLYVKPQKDMLFFNADSKDQLQFALGALKKHPYNLMLVTTKGDPVKLSKHINRPVFFAFPAIIKRFHISKVPSLLGVGVGDKSLYLAITTFDIPYNAGLISTCWHGCMESKS